MECEKFLENGRAYVAATRKYRVVGRQLPLSGARHLRLDVAAAVPDAPSCTQMHLGMVSRPSPNAAKPTHRALQVEHPFINNMDEITYWIYTKRAPCLLNYDNLVARQSEEAQAQSSKTKPISIHSVKEVPTPKKRKKRKLSMLNDDSMSAEKLQNVYFDVSQKQNQQTVESASKSNSLDSDVDFNIKNSSIRGKCKKLKLQKSSRTTLHKKNKIVTSTPKVTANLRRSLRRAQQTNNNNNSHLNSSFEIFNASAMNGNTRSDTVEQGCHDKNKSSAARAGGDQNGDCKATPITNNKKNDTTQNAQFEDLSDVSGFTANYIRSTKMTKTPRKLRCKSNRNLMKGRQSGQKVNTIVCVNKSLNTGLPKSAAAMNCSTDSSQNVINLVTTRNNGKSMKVNKSTSLLKFIDGKPNKSVNKEDDSKQKNKTNMNVSFQSSSTSRYPKRHKKDSPTEETTTNNNNNTNNASEKKRKIIKNSSDFNNSDRKENSDDILISRTRSGRNIGLTIQQPENSVLVFNNSTEQVSSAASVNVASPQRREKTRKKRQAPRNSNAKKTLDKTSSLRKDSLREKSGFAACFSDSDDDNQPLKQRKFFRA